ncbi:hypothetical protein [Massilia sp. BJB1822]|uniref:hypothetical protein n=1 Tax=Massilia sp. BJB1822 TaxID=2744470 RepID=UPI001593764E|nr:hypothetical protein [Massilia sp. BJB1822]NVE01620.1 hypothetical protein [Massilia sp. BJB1822]
MSYMSDILDKANSINPNSTASDLYLFAKAISDAGIADVPKNFVKAVKMRLFNSETVDPNELAYLQKILNFTNSWALQGAWFAGDGVIRTIGNGVNTYPLQSIADLILPQQVAIYANPGSYDFLLLNRNKIPNWYKDNTLFRVRVWGGGGSGGRFCESTPTANVSGGGGGGYAEGLLTFAQIKANSTLVVGQGGVTPIQTSAGVAGQNSSFGGVLVGGGGGAGFLLGVNGLAGGGGGGASGAAALYVASGGRGGNNFSSYGSGWNFGAGSGGGAAGGPWGSGGNGGDLTTTSYNLNGSGGGGTGGGGGTSAVVVSGTPATPGGSSAIYQDKWKTEYLQQLGGVAGINSAKNAGFGAGGAGGSFITDGNNSPIKNLRAGGHGGAFGGGGGVGSAGASTGGNADGIFAGNGGTAAGGGSIVAFSSNTQTGNGGNGMVIVEWFV